MKTSLFLLAFFNLRGHALKIQLPETPELNFKKDQFDDNGSSIHIISMHEQHLEDYTRHAQAWNRANFVSPSGGIDFAKLSCFLATLGLVFVGIAVVFHNRGLGTVLAIMAFVSSLSLMSNTIRMVYVSAKFTYPLFVTCCHQLFTCLSGFSILQCRQVAWGQKITYPTCSSLVNGVGPVAICTAGALGFANFALLYTNTHFYEMLAPANSLVTFGLGIILGHRTSLKLLLPLICVIAGLPMVVAGEPQVSFLGLAFIGMSILCRAAKAQIQSMLMSLGSMSQTFDPVELACWSSASTLVVMMIWSVISEGLAPYNAIKNAGVLGPLLISCINAAILNMAALFVIKQMGPVAQQIIGELKGVLATLGAVAMYNETVTLQEICAYILVAIGVHWYNHTDKQIQEDDAQATKSEK